MHKTATNKVEISLLILALAVGLATLGCYVRAAGPGYAVEGEYEVEGPPPAVQEEVVLASPGPDYVWIGGYYDWDLGVRHFVWRPGRWERPPHAEAHWVAPRYEERNGRHYYHRGHWDRGDRGERREHGR